MILNDKDISDDLYRKMCGHDYNNITLSVVIYFAENCHMVVLEFQ